MRSNKGSLLSLVSGNSSGKGSTTTRKSQQSLAPAMHRTVSGNSNKSDREREFKKNKIERVVSSDFIIKSGSGSPNHSSRSGSIKQKLKPTLSTSSMKSHTSRVSFKDEHKSQGSASPARSMRSNQTAIEQLQQPISSNSHSQLHTGSTRESQRSKKSNHTLSQSSIATSDETEIIEEIAISGHAQFSGGSQKVNKSHQEHQSSYIRDEHSEDEDTLNANLQMHACNGMIVRNDPNRQSSNTTLSKVESTDPYPDSDVEDMRTILGVA